MAKKRSEAIGLDPSWANRKPDGRAEFPLRDDVLPDESGHGYALRMAEANHIRGLPVLKMWLGKTRFAVLDESDAGVLAHWFGADPFHLAEALGASGLNKRSNDILFSGQMLGRFYFVNRMHPRVCPLCLANARHCRAAWDIALMTACPTHGVSLIEQCQVCHRRLSWERPAVDVCQCGWSLVFQAAPAPASVNEMGVSAWIAEKLRIGSPLYQLDRWADLNGPLVRLLQPLSLNGGLHLIHALGAAAQVDEGARVSYIREKSSIAAARDVLARAGRVVERIDRGEPAAFRVSKMSVIVQLLAESASAQRAAADRSLAHSLISAFLRQGGRSSWKSRYPQLSQLEMF